MIINITVHPNSGRQGIVKVKENYNVYLKSRPENNKANIELLRLLKKHFKKEPRIKKGFTSRKKIVEMEN